MISVSFPNIHLTEHKFSDYRGAGGGGVVVNGIKPGNATTCGEGFGGGGGGKYSSFGYPGYPGCVLIET